MTRGETLRKFRLLKGLTQKEVALELNMTHSAYAKYERDKVNIPITKWVELSKILNMPFSSGAMSNEEIEFNAVHSFDLKLKEFVKNFIERRDLMTIQEKIIAKELFENEFKTMEEDKVKMREALKPSDIDIMINWLGLEFLYK